MKFFLNSHYHEIFALIYLSLSVLLLLLSHLPCDVEPPACCLFCCDTDWSHELRSLDRKDSSDWVRMDSHPCSGATRTTRRQDSTPVSWWGFCLRVTGDPRDQPPLAEI